MIVSVNDRDNLFVFLISHKESYCNAPTEYFYEKNSNITLVNSPENYFFIQISDRIHSGSGVKEAKKMFTIPSVFSEQLWH